VCDALPNIDFIMSFAHPSDIAPGKAYLESFLAMVENSVKPIVCTAEGRRDLAEMWEISRILRETDKALQAKPYWIHYAEPISPLKHPVKSLEKLLFCAETRMPVIYSPAPVASMSAPITLAGHLTQGLAESLFGLVIHQLKAEGAPFLMGMGPAVMDLVSMQCSYNAPEYLMAYAGMVEMSHYLDLPNWGYAGTSDAQLPDGQAVYEAGLLTFISAAAGSNLNHDVGYLDFGRTGSLAMVVIMDEVIDQVRRMHGGIIVDDEHIALPVIEEAARTGDFLMHPHTYEHMKATQWRPTLIDRKGYDAWESGGRSDLLARARRKLETILADHRPAALTETQIRTLRERVAAFEPELL
jgi:trimethylamine--corrinoid protein Co-methyltransferase